MLAERAAQQLRDCLRANQCAGKFVSGGREANLDQRVTNLPEGRTLTNLTPRSRATRGVSKGGPPASLFTPFETALRASSG